METQSPLTTVMSQLFPMFVGGTLNLKEIVTNKDLVVLALKRYASQKGIDGVDILCIDNGYLHIGTSGAKNNLDVRESDEIIWKWFSDNFLSLTFVKGEGQHFSEHPIHRALCIATSITKLYNRFQIASDVTENEQEAIHSLKHKFEEWGHGSEFGTAFSISLEEIAIMQRLLNEYYAHKQYSNVFDVSNTEPSQYWILNTRNRIKMNIEDCLEYVNTLV